MDGVSNIQILCTLRSELGFNWTICWIIIFVRLNTHSIHYLSFFNENV